MGRWQELLLEARPGRERLTYVHSCNLSATLQYFEELRSTHGRNIFLFPNDLNTANQPAFSWAVSFFETFTLDLRDQLEKEMVHQNRSKFTFKHNNEIWQERPEIITAEFVDQ